MAPDLSALREGAWSLDELVDHANRLLAEVLPKDASGRVAEGVNPRLVRHYATQGLVDEPLKEGREARYLYRHLLQLLVVRRLLAEGHTSALAKRVIEGRADEELESLLAGHLTVQLVPERPLDERATFLRRVRARAGLDPAPAPASTPAPASAPGPAPGAPRQRPVSPAVPARPPAAPGPESSSRGVAPFRASSWTRLEIMDGLELLVRDDFRLPTTRLGDAELVQLLKVTLLHLEQKRWGTT